MDATKPAVSMDGNPTDEEKIIAVVNRREPVTITDEAVGGRWYHAVRCVCDQRFTPVEWESAFLAVASALGGRLVNVRPPAEQENFPFPANVRAEWSVTLTIGGAAKTTTFSDFAAGLYYCILLVETTDTITNADLDTAEDTIAADADMDRTATFKLLSSLLCETGGTVSVTTDLAFDTFKRDLVADLAAGVARSGFDLHVELPATDPGDGSAWLGEVVPDTVLPGNSEAATPETWGTWRSVAVALDAGQGIVHLSPPVGAHAWDGRKMTAEQVAAFADHFGAANLLTTQEYHDRVTSTDYRTEEVV